MFKKENSPVLFSHLSPFSTSWIYSIFSLFLVVLFFSLLLLPVSIEPANQSHLASSTSNLGVYFGEGSLEILPVLNGYQESDIRGEIVFTSNDGSLDLSNTETWTIQIHEMITNENRTIRNDIEILSGGSLTIESSEIWFNSTLNPIIITVMDGAALYVNNSLMTVENVIDSTGYSININGTLVINNSILNYLGCEVGNYTIETCSGTVCHKTYSAGIEVFSNDVLIINSQFNFAWKSCLALYGWNPIIYNNTFANNTGAMEIYDSELTLRDNQFYDNYLGLIVTKSYVIIKDSIFKGTYYNSMESCIFGNLSNITFENVHVSHCRSIFEGISCSVSIINSSLEYSYGLWCMQTPLDIDNSTLFYIDYIIIDKSSTVIKNSSFNMCFQGIDVTYSKDILIENCKMSNTESATIEVLGCKNVVLRNNTIYSGISGILVYDSEASIYDNNIANTSYVGIGCEDSAASIYNNSITNSWLGIVLSSSTGKVTQNRIINNKEGVSCVNSNAQIIDNQIANNSGWGINVSGQMPVIRENSYLDEFENPNKFGRVIRMDEIELNVKDQYGRYLYTFLISIYDGNNIPIIQQSNVIHYGPYLLGIPVYKELNSGKIEETDRISVIASWGNTVNGYSSDTKSISLSESKTVELSIPLPDIYITPEDIVISNENPKHGETINFGIKVHYDGLVPMKNVSVVIWVNTIKINTSVVNFGASDEPQVITLSKDWKVLDEIFGSTAIRIQLSAENSPENELLNYNKNNTAMKIINIQEEGTSDTWTGQTGTIACVIIVLFLIIVFIFLYIKIKNKKTSSEDIPYDDDALEKRGRAKKDSRIPKHGKKNKGLPNNRPNDRSDINRPGQKIRTDFVPGKGAKNIEKKGGPYNKKKIDKKSLKERITGDFTREGPKIKW